MPVLRWCFSLFALIFGPYCAAGNAFEIEKIAFKRQQGELVLTAFFSKPDRPPPYPAVVFLHGCSGIGLGGGLSSTYSVWMRSLNALGIAVLAVDSASPRGFGSTCGGGERRKTMYFTRPGDAYSGLQYLQSRNDIIADRVGLMGWSQGGGITLLSIVSDSIGRPQPAPTHDFAAAIAFYPSACSDAFQSKPYTKIEPGTWSTNAPLLVLHGAKDNWTPAGPCKRFIDAARNRGEPVDIVVYPNAAHSFDAPNVPLQRRSFPKLSDGSLPLIGTDEGARQDALLRVSAFLEDHLKR